MPNGEQLKKIFIAYRDADETAFRKVAESIIADEVAANHHSLANELKKIIGNRNAPLFRVSTQRDLSFLPKDRRNGDSLVQMHDSNVSSDKIILSSEPKDKISRLLAEHRNRLRLKEYGYSPKSKLLFWGPPGCGKTHCAHYIAYELGLPISVMRLSAVISSFLGDTASHLQRIFDMANTTPMVLLLDEIDAVAKARDDRNDVGELKRVVNSLLQAMDSFKSTESVVIAASNHQYLLDPAVWRRFDDIVNFPLPEPSEREKYIKYLMNGIIFNGSTQIISKKMSSLSYADIEKVIIESIKTMILSGRNTLECKDIVSQINSLRNSLLTVNGKMEVTNNE
jgi:SpoVK/Ycf46/Vps4 family AAA+-type ATPase